MDVAIIVAPVVIGLLLIAGLVLMFTRRSPHNHDSTEVSMGSTVKVPVGPGGGTSMPLQNFTIVSQNQLKKNPGAMYVVPVGYRKSSRKMNRRLSRSRTN